MSFQKFSKWLLSDAGRKFAYLTTGTISTGAILYHYLPNTVFIDEYRKIIQLYKNGFSVPVSDELNNRFNKVLDLLNIKNDDKHLYKPFHTYGFDMKSAGTSYSRFGVIIGLPANFTYTKASTIDTSKILLGDEPIAWGTEPAQNLLESLVVPENAQMYAMAREIKYRQSPKPFLDMLLDISFIVTTYSMSKNINEKFNLYIKPQRTRIFLYTLVALFTYGVYATITDVSEVLYEEQIDKELRETNKIFIEGGREYYTKVLERNKALRSLLGKDGEKRYSVLGNENYFLRTRHLPLVQRKSYFEDKVSEEQLS